MPKKSIPSVYGVLGFPVKHSLSPSMHNAALRHLKLKSRYRKFEVPPPLLKDFLHSLLKKNIRGLNVTIPHKESVLPYLKRPYRPEVEAIGAVNTIRVNARGTLEGLNTDYLGFLRHLSVLGLTPRRVAIIGAGGAAKAVCFALGLQGAQEIAVFDLYKFKTISLIQRLQVEFSACRFSSCDTLEGLRIKEKDLLVNASPVGMKPQDPCLVTAAMLSDGLFVYDLIYNPAETKLLQLARSQGLPHCNGLEMLLYQGAESFNIWFRPKKAPVEVMRRALLRSLNRLDK